MLYKYLSNGKDRTVLTAGLNNLFLGSTFILFVSFVILHCFLSISYYIASTISHATPYYFWVSTCKPTSKKTNWKEN